MKRAVYIVGLATIVVLSVWLIRSWTTWRVSATTSSFNEDIENLFRGLQTYKENVGAYPVGSNAEVIKALMGQNPKKLIIVVGRKYALNDKGEVVDPWGTPMRFYFADNAILVRSAGPNRRFDDSTTLEYDDYFRSN